MFISYPIFLKYLEIELYGLWATLSVITSFAAISKLGIDTAITKYVAEEYARNDKIEIKKCFSTAIIFIFISGIALLMILLPIRHLIVSALSTPDKYVDLANNLLSGIIILSILIFIVKIADGALRGIGRIDLANYYDLVARIISIPLTVIFLKTGHGIWSLFLGQLFLYFLIGFLVFVTIYKKLGFLCFSFQSFNLVYLKKLLRFGGLMTASQLISMFLMPFNKFIIARYINLSSVTYFEIASRMVMQIRGIFEMGISAIMPEISMLSIHEHDKSKIDSVLKKAIGLALFLGIPVFIISFIFADNFLHLWLSNQYNSDISTTFRIIAIGYALNLLVTPIYYLFLGISKVFYCFINHAIQAILNFILVYLFIALGLVTLYHFSIIYSFSIAVSALVLFIIFALYRKHNSKSSVNDVI